MNPNAAAATLKETVKSVTVELSLMIDAAKLREVKTTVEADRLVYNSARISLNCGTFSNAN